jgi:hypothetical protein
MATSSQIDIVTEHYLIACLWADCPEGTYPRATKQAKEKARLDCEKFINLCGSLFDDAMERRSVGYGAHLDCEGKAEAAFGHDYYMTRQGHGVGFWDRKELDADGLGDKLSALCRHDECYPEFYRGWLYLN